MNIEFNTSGFDNNDDLKLLARYCAGFELGTFRSQIAVVRIQLSSIEESRSGKDKSCDAEVELISGESVVARAIDSNPHVALYWALGQAGSTISNAQQPGPHNFAISERQAPVRRDPGRAA